MSDAPQYTSLRDYLRVLREQRVIIVLVVLLFAGAAVALSVRAKPVYESRASLSFRSENEDLSDIGGSAAVTETAEQRAASAAETIKSLDTAEAARELMKRKLPPSVILNRIGVQPEARTNFVVIQARDRTAENAADLANAFANAARELTTDRVRNEYADRAKTLERQNKSLKKTQPVNGFTRAANIDRINKLRTLSQFATPVVLAVEARPARSPVSPKPVRNTVLGLLIGLTVALLIAFVRDALDRRFKSVREIKEELKLPLLGHVRDDMLGRSIAANGRSALTGQELEAFRILRTNVDFLDIDRRSPTVVVTSALPEEGKSTVAGALAAAYATAGKRVLLVECDLRRPTLAKRMGLAATPGLSDFLLGEAGPKEILQQVAIETPTTLAGNGNGRGSKRRKREAEDGPTTTSTLVCITAGTPTPQPAELLGSERFSAFLEQVSQVYDAVIIDSTPLLSVVDTLEIVPLVGRVVICVRASRTTRDQARAANAALAHFPARPTGVVVTGLRAGDESDYGYYSYAYAYGPRD